MPRPIHSQPGAEVTDEVRALHKRAADCCRRDPALFARLVAYSDQLQREGMETNAASRVALDAAGA